MRKVLLTAIGSWLTASLFAQTETFDIATYTPPKGWKRSTGQGYVLFQDYKTGQDAGLCVLTVYASRVSSGDTDKDFEKDWNDLVIKPNGEVPKPETFKEKTDEGWMAVTGVTTLKEGELEYGLMLVTASGFGKVMSVLIKVVGQSYLQDAQHFLETMQLNADATTGNNNTQTTTTVTGAESLGNYVFTVPDGWSQINYTDGIMLTNPDDKKCFLNILPMRVSGGNLQTDAQHIMLDFFKGSNIRPVVSGSTDPWEKLEKGIAADGWEYLYAEAQLDRPGEYIHGNGIVFLAKLGNHIAVIVGYHAQAFSGCLSSANHVTWAKFYHRLQFKNWKPVNTDEVTNQKLVGKWKIFGNTGMSRSIFLANGNYQNETAVQTYKEIPNDKILETTYGFFGNGSWSVSGNKLTFTPHDKKISPNTVLFRITEVYKYGSWTESLMQLQTSSVTGKEFESELRKEK